jgi:L-iditol 2-dehydrogenase
MSNSNDYKVVYYAPKDLRVEKQEEKPSVKKGEVLVRVEACAICGSDIKTYLHGNPRMIPPAVIGHEFCGEIIETGAGVDGYKIGDRVSMATTMGCGECVYCLEGKPNICKNVKAMGFHCDGAMAKYAVIPEGGVSKKNLVKVADLDARIACLCEPMSCALNGLMRVPLDKVKSALVIGIGALGMFHSIALREFGVKNIVCVSREGVKKNMMDKLGFITKTPKEIEEEYLEISGGDGFDLVVITAPSNQVQSEALKYARKGGHISYFASLPVGDNMITIDSRLLHYGELVLYGTSDSTVEHVEKARDILSKHIDDILEIITVLPITDFETGIKGIRNKEFAKVVLIP